VKTFVFFFFRSIVDDSEMYEQQKPFRLNELVRISAFLNNLVFKMLWNEMVDGTYVMIEDFPIVIVQSQKSTSTPEVFRKLHAQLIVGHANSAEAENRYPCLLLASNC